MTFISIAKLLSTVRMTQIFLVEFYCYASTNNNWTAIEPGTCFIRKRVLLQPGGSPIKWILFKVTACLVPDISLLSWISKGRNKPALLLEHISPHCLLHFRFVKLLSFVICFGFYVRPLERALLTRSLVISNISVICLCVFYCFIRFFWITHWNAEYLKVKGDKETPMLWWLTHRHIDNFEMEPWDGIQIM